MSIVSAAGTLGSPGMVMMSPVEHDDEAGAGRDHHVAQRHVEVLRAAHQDRIGGERILRLGHADRQVAEAGFLQLVELVAELLVGQHVGGAVDFAADDAHLLPERAGVGIEQREVGLRVLDHVDHGAGQFLGALRRRGPNGRP